MTNTHTRRWHTTKGTVGQGHLYQGRYKSFICQDDGHFLALMRYAERNAKKAGLTKKAEDWIWGSAFVVKHGTKKQKELLSDWLVPKPKNYLVWLNNPQSETEEKSIEKSIKKSSPFGEERWVKKIVKKFNLGSTVRFPGRPRNGG